MAVLFFTIKLSFNLKKLIIMKRNLLTLLMLIVATVAVISQQVPRDKVILELFTADW